MLVATADTGRPIQTCCRPARLASSMSIRTSPSPPSVTAPSAARRTGPAGMVALLTLAALLTSYIELSRGGHRHVQAGTSSIHHHHPHIGVHDHGASHSHREHHSVDSQHGDGGGHRHGGGHGPDGEHHGGGHQDSRHQDSERHGLRHSTYHRHAPEPPAPVPPAESPGPRGSTYAASWLLLSTEGAQTAEVSTPAPAFGDEFAPRVERPDVSIRHAPDRPRGPPLAECPV